MRKFRLLTTFLIVSLCSLAAFGQRPAYSKMSALIRQACHEAQAAPATKKIPSAGQRTTIAFVKLADSSTDALTARGCRVLARYGRLCIAEIPLQAIAPLSLDKRVLRIEAGQHTQTQIDTAAIAVNAIPVQEGIDLPQGFTGKGVVVGVQDIGFDLTHPTFWSADMSNYRIKAMWDQLSYDTLMSTLPVGRDYVDQEELLAVQHPRDGLVVSHGTETAGLAAGSGAEGNGVVSPYRGIAYDADLCLVCNVTGDDAPLLDPKDYYKYTYALDALGFKYIFDYADRVGRPCVINFSEGSGMDFRGDDQLYYEMLDSLVGPGHIIVASAGNMGGNVNYVKKEASEPSKDIRCYRGERTSVMATTRSRADFTMTVRYSKGNTSMAVAVPLSRVLQSPDSTYTDSIVGNGLRNILVATAYRSCFNPDDIICDWRVSRDSATIQADNSWTMTFEMSGDQQVELFGATGQFHHHGWQVYGDEAMYSVNSPSSAPRIISVGSTDCRNVFLNYRNEAIPAITDYHLGQRSGFSSVGPTYDGRIKPDVMAPGQRVISPYSSFCMSGHDLLFTVRKFNYDGREYVWNADTGTSMSAPVVTGVIALWLQAYPNLSPEDCIDIFSKTCTHYDESLSYPNVYYGYGQIDAEAGIKLALQKAAAGIREVTADSTSDGRIYTIDGRYAGTDKSRLARGLYIMNGRKVLVR